MCFMQKPISSLLISQLFHCSNTFACQMGKYITKLGKVAEFGRSTDISVELCFLSYADNWTYG